MSKLTDEIYEAILTQQAMFADLLELVEKARHEQ